MTPTFSGEIQLAGWSESHNGGCKVTFWLQSPEELEAFRALTVRKGNTAGHRFMAALVEIGDDEQPVQPEKLDSMRAANGRPLSKEAALLCQNAAFQHWLRYFIAGDVFDSNAAAQCIRDLCGVQSRAEFDTDAAAGQRFIDKVRIPFMRDTRENWSGKQERATA